MITPQDIARDVIRRIEDRLNLVNGIRQNRTLDLANAIDCLGNVIVFGERWDIRRGGPTPYSHVFIYGRGPVTTIVLCARVDSRVSIGIGAAPADQCSPGGIWPELRHWFWPTGPLPNQDAKWSAWTKATGVITLDDCEVDALIEAGTFDHLGPEPIPF